MKKYLTTKELAEMLKVTPMTIWRWRKEGMPFKKFGNSVRFDENEVLEWLSQKDNKAINELSTNDEYDLNEKHFLKVVDGDTGEVKEYEFNNFNDFVQAFHKMFIEGKGNDEFYFTTETLLKKHGKGD